MTAKETFDSCGWAALYYALWLSLFLASLAMLSSGSEWTALFGFLLMAVGTVPTTYLNGSLIFWIINGGK